MKSTDNTIISHRKERGLDILTMENPHLKITLVPALGGKIASLYNKRLKKEFLWNNAGLALQQNEPGDDYDSNFWGGVDELLPNDIPEVVDGVSYPDHGELWTTRLTYTLEGSEVTVQGLLPLSQLYYRKTVRLHDGEPRIILNYQLTNQSPACRHFLWKQHAALQIAAGDRLETSAGKAQIVSSDASRFTEQNVFPWPFVEGVDASLVPEKNNTMDFFYLFDLSVGEMSLITDNGRVRFTYYYDLNVFPYQWYFASYGQFRGHYTAILEPASAMPVSVNDAAGKRQCSRLEAGQELRTRVVIYAGENSPGA